MTESNQEKPVSAKNPKRGGSSSMFGPVFLIALGILLLLANLGILPDLNWWAAVRLWPLLLVFIGLNIIVRQAPRPFGTVLSLVVSVLAVGVFGYILFFADQVPALKGFETQSLSEPTRSVVSLPAEKIKSAEIKIKFESPGAIIYGLEDSNDLINGEVTYIGELDFISDVSNDRATVSLETRNEGDWFTWLNPVNWFVEETEDSWEIGLNANVPLDLYLDLGSGSAELDLEKLAITSLFVDGAAGPSNLLLPVGTYDVEYDVASGSARMILPDSGQQKILVKGGSGSLKIDIPESMEIRLVIEGGSGRLQLGDKRLEELAKFDDESVWQTKGYEDALNRVEIFIDIGSGNVTIQGR